MFKRVIASCLFVAGGLVAWFGIKLLKALAASQAGMSAGPIHETRDSGTAISWLLYSYFVVSAISAIITNRKKVLWVLGSFAHSLIAVALCFACSDVYGWNTGKFVANLLALGLVTAAVFLPWLMIWGWLLSRATRV